MIEVKHSENKIIISGHAGYAPIGQDIVCAGVSTLAQNFLLSIENLTDDVVNSVATKGKLEIKYRNLSDKGKLLVDSFFVGVQMIANEYPKYVTVTNFHGLTKH